MEWKLTGKFTLRRRILGGYTVFVQFENIITHEQIYRQGDKEEIMQVMSMNQITIQ